MSLLIAARYRHGVVLASDPFVFDNDPLRPSRRLEFDRVHVAADGSAVFAAVGALWVFRAFCRQYDAESIAQTPSTDRVAEIWKNPCAEWRRARDRTDGRSASLRTISRSQLIAVRCRRPWRIEAWDDAGNPANSETFIVTGSAAGWVRDSVSRPGARFNPRDTLETCLARVRACFSAGARDLFVVGFPSIVVVHQGGVVDCSRESERAWNRAGASAFAGLMASVRRHVDARPGAPSPGIRSGSCRSRARRSPPARAAPA